VPKFGQAWGPPAQILAHDIAFAIVGSTCLTTNECLSSTSGGTILSRQRFMLKETHLHRHDFEADFAITSKDRHHQ
jgi:hypothetical protein